MSQPKAIVIGAGICGLAMSLALSKRGYRVEVLERSGQALGASIRNFGMIWPIGQPDGTLYNRAMLSRSIWKEVCPGAGIWLDEAGSLHLAYEQDELQVLTELSETYSSRNYRLLTPAEVSKYSAAVNDKNLLGALRSDDEMLVDPRQAILILPRFLKEKYGVIFHWGKAATKISHPTVHSGNDQFQADEIYVCSGADFETLYPDQFASLPITKCKLQMMRFGVQPGSWRIGAPLCGGLSLIHYAAFRAASSLPALKKRYESNFPDYIKFGIHVMAAQNEHGEITIGDSHEYGLSLDPFDKQFINELVVNYLKEFTRFKNETVSETWNGIYPKLTDGRTEIVLPIAPGVTIVNGLGGAGMTLSFGLCEELVSGRYQN